MPTPLSETVADRVRALATEKRISGRLLAELTGIPHRTVAKKLAGQHPFDLDDVSKLCGALDVDLVDLLNGGTHSAE